MTIADTFLFQIDEDVPEGGHLERLLNLAVLECDLRMSELVEVVRKANQEWERLHAAQLEILSRMPKVNR